MKILDLFCGAGGAAMGYYRAGFGVVGVDINPQPNYPFEFHQADAMTFPLEGFDAIHASPPCQGYSVMTRDQSIHQRMIGAVRERMAHVPYVIENVAGAKAEMLDPILLCGSSFGLGVRRHRYFEANWPCLGSVCNHETQGRPVGVYGNPGGSSKRDGIKFGGVETWRAAMEIDWMTGKELGQSIPPAYTEFIGRQLGGFLRASLTSNGSHVTTA